MPLVFFVYKKSKHCLSNVRFHSVFGANLLISLNRWPFTRNFFCFSISFVYFRVSINATMKVAIKSKNQSDYELDSKFDDSFLRIYSFTGWKGVAFWKWIANDDNCGICRNAFDGCCTDCKMPGDECPLVWGQCSHCFHIHCIMKWLNSQNVNQLCPMCRQDWKFNE